MTILVTVADGSEEMEVITLVDVLRRADLEVTLASLDERQVTCARGSRLVADATFEEIAEFQFELIALPGGLGGAERQGQHQGLVGMLRGHQAEGRWIGAICAAPALSLAANGLIPAKAKITGHPGFHNLLGDYRLKAGAAVVRDDQHRLITSQGPGTALAFALALVELLLGKEKAQRVAAPMVLL
ncbi:DJ-1 family glyoxalase III [Gallaecimonas sp. GXIMD4217]|uniref:DJ-1 family glyoxalase III n=1 Tax=Gallaecimonas sp. GXIMD4217 TaxID=3131927 RepID=UPI00311AF48E